MEKINTLVATNAHLIEKGGHQQKQGVQANTVNDYESKLYPKGYLWMHGYKFVRGHTRVTCTNRNDGHM